MGQRLGEHVRYEFGDFVLDARRRVIEAAGDGRTLLLEPRIFTAALYFVQHSGCVLSKERLLAELWPGGIVEENSLTQVISILRRSLGDARGEHRYIVTVPRKGYCFVADVNPVGDVLEMRGAGDCTVSVRPFDVWSALADDGQLAAGIADGIRHQLARTAGIRVVSEAYCSIPADEPGDAPATRQHATPRFVVEGRLQRTASCLRITSRLVDTEDGGHAWSMLLDCATGDVLMVEDEVSRRVAGALSQALAQRPTTQRHAGAPLTATGPSNSGLA